MSVQRYDLEWCGPAYMERQEMVKDSDGDWIRYKDHAAAVEGARVALEGLLAETRLARCNEEHGLARTITGNDPLYTNARTALAALQSNQEKPGND